MTPTSIGLLNLKAPHLASIAIPLAILVGSVCIVVAKSTFPRAWTLTGMVVAKFQACTEIQTASDFAELVKPLFDNGMTITRLWLEFPDFL